MTPALAEIRDFLAEIQFARPAMLGLLGVPLLVIVMRRPLARREASRTDSIGRPGAVAALRTHSRSRSAIGAAFQLLAWSILVLAIAGPRWGRETAGGVAIGRDIVLVIDFSRSMWAGDMADQKAPTRWESALSAARGLVEDLRSRGGHRIGIVVFAARPVVVVPLTTDYDHVAFRLQELDATVPPAESRPADDNAISGTRIGAGLVTAVELHDPRFHGFQEIILLTDGDDPAGDLEWRTGIRAAREVGIPVYAVGLGDPNVDSFLFRNGQPVEAFDRAGVPIPIQTRLHEEIVEAIAQETSGAVWSSRREIPDLGALYRMKIESNAMRELDDERLPQPRERYPLFVIPALALLALAWWRGS